MRVDAAWAPVQWPGMEHAVLYNGQARYLYKSGRFQASLQVDEHGLVLDYPGIWPRIPLQEPCHADVTGAANDPSR